MAEQVEFPDGAPEPQADWPPYLEKGTEVHGVITEFSDFRPTETYTAKSGTPYLKANLVFRVIDHDGLDGFHIRDAIQIPTDGVRFLGDQKVRDILFRKLAPFGILLTEVPIPTTEVDIVNMVTGKEEWDGTGGMVGKMVTLVTGAPSKPYTSKKTGETKGPYTSFGYFREIDPNVAELLKPYFEKWKASREEDNAAAPSAGSGGMDDDDMPF